MHGNFAALLQEDANGEFTFQYDVDYLQGHGKPVSKTLPLSPEPYHSKDLFPFFDGLIPEGWWLDIPSVT